MSDKNSLIEALLSMSPSDYGTGMVNGARSFADQAKWQWGIMGNVPRPAPYDGGAQYPSADDANAYVRNNWPNETGMSGTSGAPSIYQLGEYLARLKGSRA